MANPTKVMANSAKVIITELLSIWLTAVSVGIKS